MKITLALAGAASLALLPGTAIAGPIADNAAATLDEAQLGDRSLHGLLASVHAPRRGVRLDLARGRREPGSNERLGPNNSFRIASVTKVFVAAAVLRLHETARLDLFAPIAGKIAPEDEAALTAAGYAPDRITVYQLLTHTSGLRDYAEAPDYQQAVGGDPSRRWTAGEQIAVAMRQGAPLGAPGTVYSYADTNFLLLGEILTRSTGKTLAAAVRSLDRLDRLGLRHTYWERLEPAPKADRRAGQRMGTVDVAAIDPSVDLFGGGGLVSTTGDLATFFRALLRGELFAERGTLSLALLGAPTSSPEGKTRAQAPLMRVRKVGRELCWEHGGFWGIEAVHCPNSDVTVVVSYNQAQPGETTTGSAEREGLVDRLARLVQPAG